MKKVLALIVLGVATIGAVAWLAHYLSTGTITITASKNDTITLQKTSGGEPLTRIAVGSLSAVVKHGQYTATVKNGSKTSIQVIDFRKGHGTFRYSVSLSEILRTEPIVYKRAQDLQATSSKLVYLDSSSHKLYEIDNRNNLLQVGSREFQMVKWADPSFGVGQSSDGNLYTIKGDSISSLQVPFSYGGKVVNFDVSPDKKIYVSYGANVYSGSQAGGFKKIYTASSSKPALAAGVNGVAVSDSKYGGNASDIPKPLLATISVSGKETKKNVEAERMTWSSNGQYLAVVNQSSPTIYDTSLHKVAVIPTSSVVGQFEWLNDTTLFYSSNYNLWTYNFSDQKSQLLSDVPPTDSITGIYVSSDRSYVYVTTLDSASLISAIKRIGLRGQRVQDHIYKLQGILPENGDGYFIGLINFSAPPTILVQPYAHAQPGDYVHKAQAQLQVLGVDTAGLRFQMGPTLSGD